MLKFIERNKAELLVIGASLMFCSVIIYLFFTVYEICDPFIEETPQLTPVMQALLEELEKKFK